MAAEYQEGPPDPSNVHTDIANLSAARRSNLSVHPPAPSKGAPRPMQRPTERLTARDGGDRQRRLAYHRVSAPGAPATERGSR